MNWSIKAKLKSAFGKMSKGKVESRTLLNRFVKLVSIGGLTNLPP